MPDYHPTKPSRPVRLAVRLTGAALLLFAAGCSQISAFRPVPGAQQIERGTVQLAAGHPDRADAEFQSAVKLAGSDYRVAGEIATRCAAAREWTLASRYAEQSLASSPKSEKTVRTQLYSLLATAALALGNQDAALKFAQSCYQEDPEEPAAMNVLGYTYADAPVVAKLPEALDLTQKAVKKATEEGRPDEEVALYLDSLGWVRYQQGRIDEAIPDLTRASYLLPRVPEVLYHLGMAYMKRARYADALPVLERAAKLAPQDQRIHDALTETVAKVPPQAPPGAGDDNANGATSTGGPASPPPSAGSPLPAPHP